jgi:hypothetical protein
MALEQLAAALMGLAMAGLAMAWLWRSSARASIIERLERAMVSNQSRLDGQEAEIDELRQQINELREGRIADHALLQEWITYARRLAALFREATGQEPPPEPTEHPRPVNSNDLARLAKTIEARFSVDEMNDLALELGVTAAMSGDTSMARAGALVNAAKRRGLLVRLINLCRAARPGGGF